MSTLKADTLVASDGTSPVTLTKQTAAKVFIVFGDDADGVQVIDDSFNISSLTDNAGGDQTDNYTNNMATASGYTISGTFATDQPITNYQYVIMPRQQNDVLTGSVRMYQSYGNNIGQGITDYEYVSHVMHGDLA